MPMTPKMPMAPPRPALWMQGLADTFNHDEAKRCLHDMAETASLWRLEEDTMNKMLAHKIDALKTALAILISII
jgi:hypothetical protein